jgi:hypothetical protein
LAGYEVRLLRPAETFFRSLAPEDQQHLGTLFSRLEENPQLDGMTKIAVRMPPVELSLYADARSWILYHIVQERIVRVLNADWAEELYTPLRRPEGDRK